MINLGSKQDMLCCLPLKLSIVICGVFGVRGGFEEGRSGGGEGCLDSKAAYVQKPLLLWQVCEVLEQRCC